MSCWPVHILCAAGQYLLCTGTGYSTSRAPLLVSTEHVVCASTYPVHTTWPVLHTVEDSRYSTGYMVVHTLLATGRQYLAGDGTYHGQYSAGGLSSTGHHPDMPGHPADQMTCPRYPGISCDGQDTAWRMP